MEQVAHKLILYGMDGLIVLEFRDVVHLRADGSYTDVICANGARHVSRRYLGALETELWEHLFFRCHDSHIVNLLHVRGLFHKGGARVRMSNGDEVPVSRRREKAFKLALEKA